MLSCFCLVDGNDVVLYLFRIAVVFELCDFINTCTFPPGTTARKHQKTITEIVKTCEPEG